MPPERSNGLHIALRLMDRSYYVDLPPRVVSERWRDFEHGALFEPLADEPARTRVCVAGELERADYAIGRFRLFLESRGLIELTPRGNPREGG